MKTILSCCLYCLLAAPQVYAVPAALWGDLMRSGAKGDEVIGAAARVERVASELTSGGSARRALSHDVGEIADAAARGRKLKTLLEATLFQPNPALVREIGSLSQNELEAAVILARGSRRLIEVAPDVAARGRLLSAGGSDLVAAIGLHGGDLARDATRLSDMVSAGSIPTRIANQPALARFSEVMRSGDGGTWTFWKEYVVPHWGKWAAGGAFATYLANPEFFHDAAGTITEEGTRRVGVIIGKAVGGAMTGAAEGGNAAIGEIWQKFTKHYLLGPGAWSAWLGLTLMCWVVGMLLPRTRRVCLVPLAWLFHKPEPKQNHGQKNS